MTLYIRGRSDGLEEAAKIRLITGPHLTSLDTITEAIRLRKGDV